MFIRGLCTPLFWRSSHQPAFLSPLSLFTYPTVTVKSPSLLPIPHPLPKLMFTPTHWRIFYHSLRRHTTFQRRLQPICGMTLPVVHWSSQRSTWQLPTSRATVPCSLSLSSAVRRERCWTPSTPSQRANNGSINSSRCSAQARADTSRTSCGRSANCRARL